MITTAMKHRKMLSQSVPQGTGVRRRGTSSMKPPRRTNAVADFGVRGKHNPLNIFLDCSSGEIAAISGKVKQNANLINKLM